MNHLLYDSSFGKLYLSIISILKVIDPKLSFREQYIQLSILNLRYFFNNIIIDILIT